MTIGDELFKEMDSSYIAYCKKNHSKKETVVFLLSGCYLSFTHTKFTWDTGRASRIRVLVGH